MAGDELNRPLGVGKRSPVSSSASEVSWPVSRRHRTLTIGVGSAILAVVATVGAVYVSANPRGGEPFAVSVIPPRAPVPTGEDRQPTGSIRQPTPGQTASLAPADPGPTIENGVTIYRPGKPGDRSTGPLVIKVPEALGQSEILAVDKRLIEQTRFGPLPRVSQDGVRPRDYYARPLVFAGPIAPGTPRIALVVGGAEAADSLDSAIRLPAAVSLAFTPSGEGLDGGIARAKAAGHEVLLRLPSTEKQPGDPATHALTAVGSKAETIDALRWLMGRMSGYIGVMAGPDATTPIDKGASAALLTEVADRGLLYIAGDLDKTNGAAPDRALGRADVLIDGRSDAATQRAACLKLEAIARAKGHAIGVIETLTTNPDAITHFVETFNAKGLALVPVSAIVNATAQPVATAP